MRMAAQLGGALWGWGGQDPLTTALPQLKHRCSPSLPALRCSHQHPTCSGNRPDSAAAAMLAMPAASAGFPQLIVHSWGGLAAKAPVEEASAFRPPAITRRLFLWVPRGTERAGEAAPHVAGLQGEGRGWHGRRAVHSRLWAAGRSVSGPSHPPHSQRHGHGLRPLNGAQICCKGGSQLWVHRDLIPTLHPGVRSEGPAASPRLPPAQLLPQGSQLLAFCPRAALPNNTRMGEQSLPDAVNCLIQRVMGEQKAHKQPRATLCSVLALLLLPSVAAGTGWGGLGPSVFFRGSEIPLLGSLWEEPATPCIVWGGGCPVTWCSSAAKGLAFNSMCPKST